MLENEMISRVRRACTLDYSQRFGALLSAVFPTAVLAEDDDKQICQVIDVFTHEMFTEADVTQRINAELIPLLDKTFFSHSNDSANLKIEQEQRALIESDDFSVVMNRWANYLNQCGKVAQVNKTRGLTLSKAVHYGD